MNINITDKPNPQDEEFVIDSLWAHNHKTQPVDIHPLFLTVTDDNQQIVGGLVARTWWGGLEVQYLWVGDQCRKSGYGRQLMQLAEEKPASAVAIWPMSILSISRPEASTKNWATGSTASWATTRIATPAITWLKACNAA
jgi:hypothetical protein